MFDLVTGDNPLTITEFDFYFGISIVLPLSIYTRPGTHVGFEDSASGWTLVESIDDFQGASTLDQITTADFVDFTIPANATTAIYITATTGNAMTTLRGTGVGNVAAANSDLQLLEGTGVDFLFGATQTPRIFDGTIYYDVVPSPGTASLLGISALAAMRRRR
ncbi:MAG: hypothetical protein AAGI53_09730 [Planctomycetota bacterium]